MAKRLTKEEADRNRRALATNGVEHPRAKVLQAQIEAEGGSVRDYARSYVGYMKPDEKGYVDNEVGWEWVGRFIHSQLCNLDGGRRGAMLRLTLGDLASFWAKAAGGMCDVLDPKDGGDAVPDFKEMEQAIKLILTIEANPDVNPETIKLTETSRRQLRTAVGDWEPSKVEEVNDG